MVVVGVVVVLVIVVIVVTVFVVVVIVIVADFDLHWERLFAVQLQLLFDVEQS